MKKPEIKPAEIPEKLATTVAKKIAEELKLAENNRNENQTIYNNERSIKEKISELNFQQIGEIICELEKVTIQNPYGMTGKKMAVTLIWDALFPEFQNILRSGKDGK